MNSQEFEVEIQKLDSRFTIVQNPDRPGLSNIFFDGKNYDLPVVSTTDIKDEIDMSHRYEFPNGLLARFWSKPEITGRLEDFLKKQKEGKFEKLYED